MKKANTIKKLLIFLFIPMIMLFGYGCETGKKEESFIWNFLGFVYEGELFQINIILYNSKDKVEDIVTSRFEFFSDSPNVIAVDKYGCAYVYGAERVTKVTITIILYDSTDQETRKVKQKNSFITIVRKYDNASISRKIDKGDEVYFFWQEASGLTRLGLSGDAISQNALDYDWIVVDNTMAYISEYGGIVARKYGDTKIKAIYKYDTNIIYESNLYIYTDKCGTIYINN